MNKTYVMIGAVACAMPLSAATGVQVEVSVDASDLRGGRWHDRIAGADSVTVVLAADVTAIPDRAFADCKTLRSVRCAPGSRLKSVGKLAFMGCDGLCEVSLPPTVTSLGERCFLECESLREIEVPSGVTAIPSHCFEWCRSLERVTLPRGLKKIGSAAFIYCFALKDVAVPHGVTEVGSNAFTECRSLQSLQLPPTVRELGSYIASECVSLSEATLPKGLRTMGELMFSGCRNLRTLRVDTRVPPEFECESFIFEPDEAAMYSGCRLIVPAPEAYRNARGWRLFDTISAE